MDEGFLYLSISVKNAIGFTWSKDVHVSAKHVFLATQDFLWQQETLKVIYGGFDD